MNPYNLLKRLGFWRSLDAAIVSKDGARYALQVKPEEIQDAVISGQFETVVRIRVWSTSDAAVEPREGDWLEVTNDDGTVARYAATRSPSSTRYWDWRFLRNGSRKIFYTRY